MIASTKFVSLLLACLLAATSAFAPVQQQTTTTTTLSMAPKWDGDQWVASTPEEGTDAYPAYKTLLLHGPIPFYNRVFKAGDYEQAVLKFMASDKCDRLEAQGNMDFYLANPNDWAFNRFEMEKKGTKYDYTTLKQEALALTLVWSSIVLALSADAVYALTVEGASFWDFLK